MAVKLILALVLLLGPALGCSGDPASAAEPDYAKWGRMAMQETQKRYHADIVDYKHVGRRQEQSGLISETFRLILDKGAGRFGVTVRIWFDRDTERVVRIQFTEDANRKRPTFYRLI